MTKMTRMLAAKKKLKGMVDYDYLDKLSEEEKKWLDKFSSEYYGANLKNKNLSAEERKQIFDANNARNRDLWNNAAILLYGDCDGPSEDTK